MLVVDARRQFVAYVPRAVARRALREQRVTLFRAEPPAVMLPVGEDAETFRREEQRMTNLFQNRSNPGAQQGAPRGFHNSWHTMLATPRPIWVQNVGGTQISMTIEGMLGGPPVALLIPLMREPICLTDDCGFEQLAASQEFRRLMNRQPAVLKLMEEDAAYAWYTDAAKRWGLRTAEEALDRARDLLARRRRREPIVEQSQVPLGSGVNFAPPKSMQDLMGLNGASAMGVHPNAQMNPMQAAAAAAGYAVGPAQESEEVSARVLALCQQVSLAVSESERMPAETFMAELEILEPNLTLADFGHINANGTYRVAKNWARRKATEKAGADGDGLPSTLDAKEPGTIAPASIASPALT